MSKRTTHPKPHRQTIKRLLKDSSLSESVETIGKYLEVIRTTSERWQEEDWKALESDEDVLLNTARNVGQIWFRGHANCDLSLRPGLYRKSTRKHLRKQSGSPVPAAEDALLSNELFELEHELRIDFTSYGHLLNEANQAKTAIDWYFLMQHHGVPTRLLDWTTNALAALFFSLDEVHKKQERDGGVGSESAADIAVWMVDAYWLADRLSNDWLSPLLPWSADAERYVPKLETLIDKPFDSKALPRHAMPYRAPGDAPTGCGAGGSVHHFWSGPQDLLEERIRPAKRGEFRLEQIRFKVDDVEALLRDLAQLGVSREGPFSPTSLDLQIRQLEVLP